MKATGDWWPTLIRHSDGDGEITVETKLAVRALDGDAFKTAFAKALASREQTLFLNEPQPTTKEAKQAALDGKRSFESELAAGKRGFRWLEMRYLAMKRRNEEAKQALLSAASDLAESDGAARYTLAAQKWLEQRIAEEQWTRSERDGFRNAYLNNLNAENRSDEVSTFLDAWLKAEEGLPGAAVLQRYAVAMVELDEVERAHHLIEKWLRVRPGAKAGKLDPDDQTRLEAALNFLFKNNHRHNTQTIDERFHKPLAKAVRSFALHPKHHNFAVRIMGDRRFPRPNRCASCAPTARKHSFSAPAICPSPTYNGSLLGSWPTTPPSS